MRTLLFVTLMIMKAFSRMRLLSILVLLLSTHLKLMIRVMT